MMIAYNDDSDVKVYTLLADASTCAYRGRHGLFAEDLECVMEDMEMGLPDTRLVCNLEGIIETCNRICKLHYPATI